MGDRHLNDSVAQCGSESLIRATYQCLDKTYLKFAGPCRNTFLGHCSPLSTAPCPGNTA